MRRTAARICTGVVAASALGLVAGPVIAQAAPLPVEAPAQSSAPRPEPVFAPQSGSAANYNALMCTLSTVSADAPCIYT